MVFLLEKTAVSYPHFIQSNANRNTFFTTKPTIFYEEKRPGIHCNSHITLCMRQTTQSGRNRKSVSRRQSEITKLQCKLHQDWLNKARFRQHCQRNESLCRQKHSIQAKHPIWRRASTAIIYFHKNTYRRRQRHTDAYILPHPWAVWCRGIQRQLTIQK